MGASFQSLIQVSAVFKVLRAFKLMRERSTSPRRYLARARVWCGATRVVCCLLCASAGLLQGCASTSSSAGTSPVAGWRFQIAVKFPSQQRYELFRITPTGEIQYGGGMSAMNDYTTWETALTPEQAKEFVALVSSLSWIQNVPKETGDDKTEPVFVVKYQEYGGSERNFAIRGSTPETDKVVAFLKGLTQRRFQSTLQKLPEATEKPKTPAAPAPATTPQVPTTPAPTTSTTTPAAPAPTTTPPTTMPPTTPAPTTSTPTPPTTTPPTPAPTTSTPTPPTTPRS